jgi:CMP-N-acetylneuraminic acid synthetase
MMEHHVPEPRIVALVPMKGHSERVPNKNFRAFNGKPLYRWIVDALLELPEVAEVVINTDARATFEAQGVGALPRVRLRDRKPELCGDFVSMNKVLADDVANVPADIYVMTHSTNPLLLPGSIRKAIAHYRAVVADGSADSVFAVNRFQTRFYRGDGSPINHDPKNLIRTQDLEPWYEENSNLYIFSAASFAASGARIGVKPKMFETPRAESLDIDDQEGWEMAEAVSVGRERLK